MSITPKQRTMILAAVAAVGITGVAVDNVIRTLREDPAPSATPAMDPGQTVPVLPGAPPGDLAALRKRYRPIVLKGPFKTRDFKDRPVRRPRETPKEDDPEPVRPSKPGDLLLRLTSFVGAGKARVGLFEERASGTALFAKPGETLAGVAVKSVESEKVVVVLEGKERTYSIGETLTLPASARKVLEPLRPAGSVKSGPKKRYTGATKLPELSEKKKMSILERLKARRRASKLRAEGKKPEDDSEKTPKEEPKDEPAGDSKPADASKSSKDGESAAAPQPSATPAKSAAPKDTSAPKKELAPKSQSPKTPSEDKQ
jgi:hypothetical protein